MAVNQDTTGDQTLDFYLAQIRAAEYGKNARTAMASAVDRCYNLGIIKAGGPKNGINANRIKEHTDRIKTAVFGEEVRDALITVLSLCYSARGINVTSNENTLMNNLRNAQTGEELKNGILTTIIRCCRDVR